ncbi:hypothetical protein FS837_007336 [Tulasnella sp. UAMH 9824]|nr:hypothetical protein FS837_007336 [Tulasnella sp. UAMH 9824]
MPTEVLIYFAIFNNEIPQPTDYPQISPTDSLWSLMRKCWNSEPSGRPPMMEILAELKDEISRCDARDQGPEAEPAVA